MSISIDKDLMNRHFSLHAGDYDSVTPIQATMGQRLLSQVGEHWSESSPTRILELGCGTGRLTAALTERFPKARITAIDMSAAMLQRASQRLPAAQVTWRQADAEEIDRWHDDPPADLIVSNAMIQWLIDPPAAIGAFRRHLQPGGLLAISTFGADTFRELRTAFAQAETALQRPHQSRTLDMMTAEKLARAADTSVTEEHLQQWFPEVRDFLRSLKLTGATLADPTAARPVDRTLYRHFLATYERLYRDPHHHEIPATWHCLYLLCHGRPCGRS